MTKRNSALFERFIHEWRERDGNFVHHTGRWHNIDLGNGVKRFWAIVETPDGRRHMCADTCITRGGPKGYRFVEGMARREHAKSVEKRIMGWMRFHHPYAVAADVV